MTTTGELIIAATGSIVGCLSDVANAYVKETSSRFWKTLTYLQDDVDRRVAEIRESMALEESVVEDKEGSK